MNLFVSLSPFNAINIFDGIMEMLIKCLTCLETTNVHNKKKFEKNKKKKKRKIKYKLL